MIAPDTARCALHPEVVAVTVCARCGSFACTGCRDRDGLCRRCSGKLDASALSVVIALLGTVSMCGLFPLGLVAVALSFYEAGRVARGESAPKSADWAKGGRVLGATSLLIAALIAFAYFF